MKGISGQVVLVTGAGSGIGRATALKLHEHGAKLALTDINESGVRETTKLCGGGHVVAGHIWRVLDVTDTSAVEAQVQSIAAHFGGHIHHVFHSAGVNPTAKPLLETSKEYFSMIVDVNLTGTFNVTKATIPFVTAAAAASGEGGGGAGSYVNVSSIAGLRGLAGVAPYCAAKYGVIGFSKAMALELGPKGVRVNVVAPGFIVTPSNPAVVLGTREAVERLERGNALGRMGTAEEVAEVAVFLMSDGARYVNGSVVEIDGMLT